jgi:hypothetical protein
MIVNEDSSIINKWSFKLIDDACVVIYDHNRFIIQARDHIDFRIFEMKKATTKIWNPYDHFQLSIPNFSCSFFHFKNSESDMICGLYYKPIMIANEDYSIVNKWGFKLIDNASG